MIGLLKSLLPAFPIVLGLVGLAPLAAAAETAPDFERDVAPILARHCLECHHSPEPAGGLDLSRAVGALAGGESGSPALAPGNAAGSAIVVRVTDRSMPPAKGGLPLAAEQIATLEAWIAAGAHWPAERELTAFEFSTDRRAGLDWWSLQPVRRPDVPATGGGTLQPIDAFLQAGLAERGLAPAREADRRTLIRRLAFDLTGLPPAPEAIDAFVADERADAYERLVDALLASPRYGERWARHWLDVVRFGESNGYETNTARANAWPYRDYVIASFNNDTPYAQFIVEQLAGDQIGVDAATGFLVGGTHDEVGIKNIEGQLQQRVNDLDDMLSTTAATFLGLTAGCAKCHDHKFDPLSQTDYYALQAAFAGVYHGERPAPAIDAADRQAREPQVREQLAQIESQMADLLAAHEALAAGAGDAPAKLVRPPVSALGNVDRFTPIKAKFVRFTILGTNSSEPCLDELEVFAATGRRENVAAAAAGGVATASSVYANGGLPIHQLAHVNDGQYGNGRSWISAENGGGWVQIEFREAVVVDRAAWARDREGKFADRLPIAYRIETALEPDAWQVVASNADRQPFDPARPGGDLAASLPPAAAAAYRELTSQRDRLREQLPSLQSIYAGTFRQPEGTHRLYRGEPMQPREPVLPGSPVALGAAWKLPADSPESARRLALARWIGSESNPRTARVMVNRIWQHHFGRGLVAAPSDLGWHGGRPSHPELLDWLASEFVASGWSIKAMHRTIVLSHAYRQSSATDARSLEIDADNRWLWRYSPRRLEAEPIRDAILSATGKLDLRMGGKGYDPFEPNTNYVKVYKPKTTFGPAEWRRMVYESKARMQVDATFGAFDCPDASASLPRRNVSTTAIQALNLFNGEFVVQQAELFAERLIADCGPDAGTQVDRAFRLAFGRRPEGDEREASLAIIQEHGLAALCRALLNANEFVYVD